MHISKKKITKQDSRFLRVGYVKKQQPVFNNNNTLSPFAPHGNGKVASCEVSGISAGRIMFRHLLPNITGPILISFTFGVAGAILAESSLSFLGFGVQPPTPSWGGLLRQAFDNPLDYWHLTFFPGLALFSAVLSFNFFAGCFKPQR